MGTLVHGHRTDASWLLLLLLLLLLLPMVPFTTALALMTACSALQLLL
jgi:hypothetical protein